MPHFPLTLCDQNHGERIVYIEQAPLKNGFVAGPDRYAQERAGRSFKHGIYEIGVHRHRNSEASGYAVYALVKLGTDIVGYSDGHLINLKRYADPDEFVFDMDGIDQMTFDAAEAIKALGHAYWWTRDHLFISSHTEVLAPHRQRGLGGAAKNACIDLCRNGNRTIDLLLQPFALGYESVAAKDANGRPVISIDQREAKTAEITAFWLRRFPYLSALPRGGPDKDRRFFLGRVPAIARLHRPGAAIACAG
jgi:hypothetical protein